MSVDPAHVQNLLGHQVGQVRFDGYLTTEVHQTGERTLQSLIFRGNHGEDVPALFLPPATDDSPAVLYCHAHGGKYDIGLLELTEGRPALSTPWLPDLAAMGFAVLCLEMPCFGTRQTPESARSKAALWRGRPLFGQMLAEQVAGLDWLVSRPGIDAGRIAALGISMGGTLAWWLAALEPRIAAAISMCALSDLDTLIEMGLHDRHGHYMTVPGLLAHCRTGELAALAAPRPLFVGLGLQDWSSPPEAVRRLRLDLDPAYAGAPDALHYHIEPDAGHEETPAMRLAARDFLIRHLVDAR